MDWTKLGAAVTALGCIVACGSGDSNSKGGGLANGNGMPLIDTQAETAGDNCENGGVAIISGTDANGDGSLSGDEITGTEYVCNATTPSDSGQTGGSSQLIETMVLMVGNENCPFGGTAFNTGTDANGDGKLSSSEIDNTRYACNGADTAGAALIDTSVLPVGDDNCPNGGVQVDNGIDTNNDGVLDPAEVTQSTYVCHGVDSACEFPTVWNDTTLTCERSADWADADLAAVAAASSYLAGLDLSGANLTGANLSWSALNGADLSGADLTGADLSNIVADGANFTDAVANGADFTGADLRYATLTGITGTDLVACPERLPNGWLCLDLGASGKTLFGPNGSLNGMDLTGADLSEVNLNGFQAINLAGCPADLPQGWMCLDLPNTGNTLVGPHADLSGLDLSGADLSAVSNLRDVNFNGSDLTNVTFATNVNLNDATFVDATLTGATFGDNATFQDTNFQGANLTGTTFNGSDLQDANFQGANLTNVTFGSGTDLQGANFDNANLSGTTFASNIDLGGVSFDGTNLTGATLSGLDLNNRDLQNATLTNVTAINLDSCPDSLPDGWACINKNLVGPTANLTNANLNGRDLSDMSLDGAILDGADLGDANLQNTTLIGASLVGTDLTNADLSNANLTGADLTGADLSGADLSNADFTNADLTNANLDGATVTSTDFTGVTWDNTTCPNGSNSNDNGGTCL